MSVHKHITQDGRPNGKAYKQHPKAFNREKGKLVTDQVLYGRSFPF